MVSRSLASYMTVYRNHLEEHGIVLLIPTEALKVTSFTLTCAFSSNYAYMYLYIHVAVRVR